MKASKLNLTCQTCGDSGTLDGVYIAEGHLLMVEARCVCGQKWYKFPLGFLITQCPDAEADLLFLKEAKITPY